MQTFSCLGEGKGHLRLEKHHEQKSRVGKDQRLYKNKKPVPHGPVNKKL